MSNQIQGNLTDVMVSEEHTIIALQSAMEWASLFIRDGQDYLQAVEAKSQQQAKEGEFSKRKDCGSFCDSSFRKQRATIKRRSQDLSNALSELRKIPASSISLSFNPK